MGTYQFYGDGLMLLIFTSLFSKMSPLKPTGFIPAACCLINKGVALPFYVTIDNSIRLGIPISFDYPLPRRISAIFSRFSQAWLDIPAINNENYRPETPVTGRHRIYITRGTLRVIRKKKGVFERIKELIR